jgi:hypothetical protein
LSVQIVVIACRLRIGAGSRPKQRPIERFYGIGCGLRDPENPLRFTQPPGGPIAIRSAGPAGVIVSAPGAS